MVGSATVMVVAALGAVGAALAAIVFIYITGCAPRWVLSMEARLFRLFKRRKRWSWHQVDDLLFIGSLPRWPEHMAELREQGVGAVLSLNEPWELALSAACVRDDCGMVMRQLSTPDFFAPSQRDLVEAVAFISAHVQAGTGVYVHCNGGRGRSATAVICYLIHARGETSASAYELLRAKRPIANLRALCGMRTQWRAVLTFERELEAVRAELASRGFDARDAELFVAPRRAVDLAPRTGPTKAGKGGGHATGVGTAARRSQVLPVVVSTGPLPAAGGEQDSSSG